MFGLGKKDSRADKSKSSGKTHVADALRCEALTPADPSALVFSAGVPGTADALAYEQYQGIVAVSTSDGRIKLMGRPGVERTLYSAARYPYATRQLAWLKNRGVLMRVSKGGFMESWSVASGPKSEGGVRALGTLKVKHDKVCCVADMARDPYVLLGCASGCLRIAQLVDGQGEPTSQARHARGFGLAPYRIRPEELGGEGSVQQLAVQSFGPIHRALVLFTGGMVAVWDLRAAQLISLVNPADPEAAARAPALAAAGEATAVCWIGTSRGDFATGHVDGSVLVWALPGLDVGEAELAAVLRVVSSTAEPIRMLRCLYGEVDGLLVAGGQEVEAPEGLTLLPLPDAEEHEEEDAEEEAEEEGEDEEAAERRRKARRRSKRPRRVKLPWFGPIIGFSLVTQGGNINGYEDPCAVLELVEGGQLVLYHLGSRQPSAVGPAFQQRTTISVAEAPLVPVRRPSGAPAAAITLSGLRRVAPCPDAGAGSDEEGSEEDPDDPGGLGAFACGSPPLVPSDAGWGLVYCTGYKDGGVCLWDLHGGTTRRLASAPAGEAADATKLGGSGGGAGSSAGGAGGSAHGCGAVTCLSLIWPTGLVVTGHARGEARVYQFSPTERAVECVTLDSVNTAGTSSRPLRQPAGLQLRLRVRVSSGEVSSLAYNQAIRALAIGDRAGGIALVDTSKPLVRWVAMPGQQPVAALALAPLPLPPQRLRVPEVLGEEGAPSCCVVAADGEGCLAALDAARGCFVGRGGELRPKNTSTPLCLELLDEAHRPLWGRQALGAGCDQAALGGGGGGGGAAGTSRARVPESEGSEDDEDEEDPDLDPDADLDELLARAAAHVDGRGGGAGSRKAKARGAQKGGGGAGSRHRAGSDDLDDASVGTGVATAACPDPTAHYVLLVTDRYLRLYSAASVLTGERAVESKRSPAEGAALVFAQPLAVGGAPGVVALATAEHGLALQVYSLPSLDLVHEAPLSACLSWFWDVPSGAERKLARLAACSRLGQLLLLGLSNELLGISLARALPPIPPPSGLFDGATASAALAAAAEYEEGHLRLDEASR
ncbi:hypothetical protein HYH03_017181 [Edaphochlamys debaryana]|uniref:Uncharacterized protein n=1 Tax=Edaphochlamys debaryana TaxID=47281 RepID=A0A836BQQ7_9CHLO|nr:hypothetical protein HYH03_017181 [Edaphochlamys debaryana]|eukprot:KAG2484014.1 hypothetical protein HYH03_017181 [Edaphochlamys debaryana]